MSDPSSDIAAPVPDVALTLAYERTRIAYERTMMAWIRTATALITFGFSVYKFFEFEMKNSPLPQMLIGPRVFGMGLIVIGLLTMMLGSIEHARDLRGLRRRYVGMPKTFTGPVAIVVAALGLAALVAVVLRA